MIRKLPGQRKWRLYSRVTHKNLGTFNSRGAAVKHEREVEYFKRFNSGIGPRRTKRTIQ